MAINILAALVSAVVALVVGLLLSGNVRRRRLPTRESGPGIFGRYLERLHADLDDAGLEGLAPLRALLYFVLAGLITGLVIGVIFGLSLIGIIVALLVTFFFARDRYVGSRAKKIRTETTAQVAEAARELSDSVEAGMAPLDAIKTYAGRAGPGAASEQVTGRINRVARAMGDAIARVERGMATEEALRAAVDPLNNRYFSNMIEAYIQTAPIDAIQLVTSLRRVAKEVDNAILLRDERLAAIAGPKNSNRIVGGVITLILLILAIMLPGSGIFFQSIAGQIFLIVVASFWYLGNRFLQSGYGED